MKNLQRSLLLALGLLAVPALLRADQLLKYPFGSPGQETVAQFGPGYFPSNVVANLSATPVTNGLSGRVEVSSAATIPANAPYLRVTHVAPVSSTPALAVANQTYFHFTMTPGAGYVLNLTNLSFNAARGGASTPRGYAVRTSVDNFGANLAQADLLTARPTYTAVSINLGAAFLNLTGLTVRVYIYAPATGSSVDFDDIVANGSVVPPANPPTGLVASSLSGQVSLSWTASPGATNYVTKRGTVSGGPYTRLATNATTSYVDSSVVNGTTYFYVVAAQALGGESADSTQATATPVNVADAPTGLVTANGDTQVTLAWMPSATATNYVIKRSLTSGSGYVRIRTNATTSYVDTGLVNGTPYFYVVSAFNAGGESLDSAEASGTPNPGPTGVTAVGGDAAGGSGVEHFVWRRQLQRQARQRDRRSLHTRGHRRHDDELHQHRPGRRHGLFLRHLRPVRRN